MREEIDEALREGEKEKDSIEDVTDLTPDMTHDSEAEAISESDGENLVPEAIDYDEIIRNDVRELRSRFPELSGILDITDLENPIRYAELRDLGLSPREAYLATSERRQRPDTRRHLSSAVPKRAAMPAGLSQSELSDMRELFSGLSDAELNRLARRVNG